MCDRAELTANQAEQVNGGTTFDSLRLHVVLGVNGYGDFTKANSNYPDIDKMKSFFASKGYTFIHTTKDEDVFIDSEGNTHDVTYIVRLIINNTL